MNSKINLFPGGGSYAGLYNIDFGISPNDKVVDVGGGYNTFPQATHVIDMIDKRGQRHGRPINVGDREFIDGDVCEVLIDFPDNHFDFCYSSHTFEHIENLPLALELISRKCKRGFYAVPASDFEFFTARKSFFHVNLCRLIHGVLHIAHRPENSYIELMSGFYEKIMLDPNFHQLFEGKEFRFIWEARCLWEDKIRYEYHDNALDIYPQISQLNIK